MRAAGVLPLPLLLLPLPLLLLPLLLLLLLQCARPAHSVLAQESQPPPSASNFPDSPVNVSTICSQGGCSCEGRVATCDCQTKVLRLSRDQFAGDDIVELHVRRKSRACLRVTVKSDTFHHSSVKRVKMENLRKVVMQENSFRTGRRHRFMVDLHNVEELVMVSHSFSGSISNISFINTTTSVPDKAFVDTGPSTTVTFENSTLIKISSQAFAHSRLSRLEFAGCNISTVESEVISPEHLSGCRLTDCTVGSLQSAALRLSLQTLDVTGCRFDSVAAGALAVRCSGHMSLHNNTFGAVSKGGFSQLGPAGTGARLEFYNNRLLQLAPGALSFSANLSADQLSVQRLGTQQPCRCHLRDWLQLMSGADAAGWLLPQLVAAVRCRDPTGRDTTLRRFLRMQCQPYKPPAPRLGWKRYIVGAAVAAALVTVLCAVTCFAVWRHSRRRQRRHHDRSAVTANALHHRPHKLNNANLYSDDISRGAGGGGRWQEPPAAAPRRPMVVAVPDVKTYTETELHVVLETQESIEPIVLPRLSSTGTLQRLRDGPRRPAAGGASETDEPQSPGCRKSCPL